MDQIFESDRAWQAQFITCTWEHSLPVITKNINIDQKILSADVHVCGLGLFEMQINGKRVSENLFEPGETNFDKKAFYTVYDITDMLQNGQNELSFYLGKGFYYNAYAPGRYNRSSKIWGELMLIAEISVIFQDGSRRVFGTDETWQYYEGPITECSWLGGEDFNANILPSGFANCRFVETVPFKELVKRNSPPIRAAEKVKAVAVKKLANGDYTVKFERNFAGIYTFTAKMKPDTKLTFLMGEFINDDGTVDQRSCVFNEKSFDTYIANNSGEQSYTPKFVYHAGQYMQIGGAELDITTDMITGYAVRCMNKRTGFFNTSNQTVNRIHRMILNSVCDNMQSVLTDCPHREKLGWLEQSHLLYDVFAANFDIEAYSRKISQDMIDAQQENGSVPSIVPPLTVGLKEHALRNGSDTTPNDPTWCGAVIFVPYYSYLEYGNRSVLENAYPAMVKYFDYLSSLAQNGDTPYLLESRRLNRDLGDWVSLAHTDGSFVVSCIYYQLACVMSKTAELLGYADRYGSLAEKIKNAVNETFYDSSEKQYADKTQTANALPLYLGIVPEEDRSALAKNLAANVIKHDCHLTCGEVGIKPLFYSLSDFGYCDLVYNMIMHDDMPSYKYFTDIGRTTLPEGWEAEKTWSQNHCMLGLADAWFYRYIGGIRNAGVAYDKVTVAPYYPPDIDHARVQKQTPHGIITVEWNRTENGIELSVSAPDGVEILNI